MLEKNAQRVIEVTLWPILWYTRDGRLLRGLEH